MKIDGAIRRPLRAAGLAAAVALAAAALVALITVQPAVADTEAAQTTAAAKIERGQYLVTITGCGDCHTPFKMGPNGPEPDMARMLAGHPEELAMPPAPALTGSPWVWVGSGTNTAFAGPWGVSYAPNLTPDETTGIGIWTEDIFVKALRTGRHWGQSRPIMPPMPWPGYSRMTDEDLSAIFAYLKSVPPVKNRVPDSQPAAPPQAAGK